MTRTEEINRLVSIGFSNDLAEATLTYIDALNEADAKMSVDRFDGKRYSYYAVDPKATRAGKYVRVVCGDDESITRGRSVHAFIVKADGRVCKTAGWAGPAKSTAKGREGTLLSKYNLTDAASLASLIHVIDSDPKAKYGGYLYQ